MYDPNPYAPPSLASGEPIFAAQVAGQLPIASQGMRFINFILDSIITQFLSGGVGFVFGVLWALSRADPTAPVTPQDEAFLNIFGAMLGILTSVTYFTLTEFLLGRSLAKFATGTRVVRADGGRPTFGQILGRTAARFIPFEAFSFFGGRGYPVGWHDSLSGTRVIKAA